MIGRFLAPVLLSAELSGSYYPIRDRNCIYILPSPQFRFRCPLISLSYVLLVESFYILNITGFACEIWN